MFFKKILSFTVYIMMVFTPSALDFEESVNYDLNRFEVLNEDQKKGWKVLGRREVKGGLERDQIMVNAKKGTFRQVKVQVKNGSVEMTKMILHFEKKEKQVVWLRKNFKDKSWSRVINVKGGKRVIKRVVFWYGKKEGSAGKPAVFLWGRQ